MRTDGLPHIFRHVLRGALALLAIVFAGGILSATLVRFSPGYGVDERELDSHLSSDSIASIRQSHEVNHSVLKFYGGYIRNIFRGEFGTSETFQRPISELIRERTSVSLHSLAGALTLTWTLVLPIALGVTGVRNRAADFLPSLAAGGLMAMPAAMIALWSAGTGRGTQIALTLILAPTTYRYTRNVLERSFHKPHIMAARARGIGKMGVLARHVLPIAAPQIIGLIAVSISMAFGALIPVEFICDSPGIGQLALQAALGRDLPLLVSITMGVTIITFLANTAADTVNEAMSPISA